MVAPSSWDRYPQLDLPCKQTDRCEIITFPHTTYASDKNVKRCQVVKKMSNVIKTNIWTMEEVPKKIN